MADKSRRGSTIPATKIRRNRSISDHTFTDCLQILLVHTEALASHAISYYLQLATREQWVSDASLVSNFSVELKDQCATLKNAIQVNHFVFSLQGHLSNTDTSLAVGRNGLEREQLMERTEQLMDLYAWLQPYSMTLGDRAQSYYLLAQHLAVLSEYHSLLGYRSA